ncbi:hypothetical protein [Lactobacillus apis]|uniref:Putative integrase-recombinase n=1 Tax=Lactobacillus apis TaxID=303541 RepID=A0A0F4LMY0_9LACO|nr:hypothetical protein [Lactobacillus apis]KJY59668.1 putative integrase-recombinase [Lactobacillus apis]MCT6888090.1 integrase-recombinase [Lactobacillus sp.]
MTQNYPHQNDFLLWCRQVENLNPAYITFIDESVTAFWQYYSSNTNNIVSPNNVTDYDVSNFLSYLENHKKLQVRTVNKYLLYIQKYFGYLASNNIIDSYPLYKLKGKSFPRKLTVYVNWMKHIPEFIDSDFRPETIKLLVLISLGYDLDQLLKVKWHSIANNIHDTQIKTYIQKNVVFENFDDPTIFQSQSVPGKPLTCLNTIEKKVKLDQDKTKLPLLPTKLRQGYILSLVSDDTKTDKQLKDMLKCNSKSLSYYKHCASYYNLIEL